MKRTVLMFVAGAALLAGPNLAFEQHTNNAAYDNTKSEEVEVDVKEYVWLNPNSFERIDVTTKECTKKNCNLHWGTNRQ